MSPSGPIGLYLDNKQSNSKDEPTNIGGFSNYSIIYNYDPIPKDLTPEQQSHIIGVQGNVWTEYIRTPEKIEYMILPRMFALSEIAWSPVARKDVKNLIEERLPVHLSRLDKTSTNYWVPTPIGQSDKMMTGENFTIVLKEPIPGSKIYYTLDLSRPSLNATLYTVPLKVTVPTGQKRVLKTIVVTPGRRMSVVTETVMNNGAPDEKTK
jgi:hexosaminidase